MRDARSFYHNNASNEMFDDLRDLRTRLRYQDVSAARVDCSACPQKTKSPAIGQRGRQKRLIQPN